jgi:hypothetical protein
LSGKVIGIPSFTKVKFPNCKETIKKMGAKEVALGKSTVLREYYKFL